MAEFQPLTDFDFFVLFFSSFVVVVVVAAATIVFFLLECGVSFEKVSSKRNPEEDLPACLPK